MAKFPQPHLFKITIQSKPVYKVQPSKGEGTEHATACDSTHAAHPRQAQQRYKFNRKWLIQWKGCALPLLNYSLSIPYADNPKQEPPMQANALDHNKKIRDHQDRKRNKHNKEQAFKETVMLMLPAQSKSCPCKPMTWTDIRIRKEINTIRIRPLKQTF